jgi:serine/threonine protein kinase
MRFLLFSQILKRCRHRNIVRLLGFALDNTAIKTSSVYLVYENLENGSLASHLLDNDLRRNLSARQRIQIMMDIASALDFLHSGEGGYKFFHRDVHPGNICLTFDDHMIMAKLIDYGLASYCQGDCKSGVPESLEENFSRSSRIVGAPGYRCPEYNRCGANNAYLPAFDIFSFGVVVLELITGSLQGQRLGDLVTRYQLGFSMDEVDDDVKPDWENVLDGLSALALECTSPYSAQRPSAAEIWRRLDSILAWMQSEEQIKAAGSLDDSKSLCFLCEKEEVVGLTCAMKHFACHKCLKQSFYRLRKRPYGIASCLKDGCTSPEFSANELLGKVPKRAYDEMAKSSSSQMDDHAKALAEFGPHARLLWIIPGDGGDTTGANWVDIVCEGSFRLYVMCQHSFTCVEPPLVARAGMEVSWDAVGILALAPAIKHSTRLLAAAARVGLLTNTLPFTSEIRSENAKVDAYSRFADDLEDLRCLAGGPETKKLKVATEAFECLLPVEARNKLIAVRDKKDTVIFVQRKHAQFYHTDAEDCCHIQQDEDGKRTPVARFHHTEVEDGCHIQQGEAGKRTHVCRS